MERPIFHLKWERKALYRITCTQSKVVVMSCEGIIFPRSKATITS